MQLYHGRIILFMCIHVCRMQQRGRRAHGSMGIRGRTSESRDGTICRLPNGDYRQPDGTFELEKPEIILYVPNASGEMEMVAVEYAIVPADPENPGNPPVGFSGDLDEWHFNEMIGQWQLHVWTILENPDGIFAPTNPVIGD